jgi:hypothetical protein
VHGPGDDALPEDGEAGLDVTEGTQRAQVRRPLLHPALAPSLLIGWCADGAAHDLKAIRGQLNPLKALRELCPLWNPVEHTLLKRESEAQGVRGRPHGLKGSAKYGQRASQGRVVQIGQKEALLLGQNSCTGLEHVLEGDAEKERTERVSLAHAGGRVQDVRALHPLIQQLTGLAVKLSQKGDEPLKAPSTQPLKDANAINTVERVGDVDAKSTPPGVCCQCSA